MNGETRSRVVDQEAGSTPSTLRDEDHPSTQRLFRCLPFDIDLNPLRIVSDHIKRFPYDFTILTKNSGFTLYVDEKKP